MVGYHSHNRGVNLIEVKEKDSKVIIEKSLLSRRGIILFEVDIRLDKGGYRIYIQQKVRKGYFKN